MQRLQCKAFTASDVKLDTDERSAVSYITTATPDRDNEVILPSALDRSAYNNVVLWSHDHFNPAIGKCAWIKKDGSTGWVAKTIFATTAFAEDIWQLVKGGFVTACSVGFDGFASEFRQPTAREAKQAGWEKVNRVWTKVSLLEYSWVNVGANPDALAIAVSEKRVKLTDSTLKYLELSLPQPKPENLVLTPQRRLIYDPTDAATRRVVVQTP